jgi:hypothetical protein
MKQLLLFLLLPLVSLTQTLYKYDYVETFDTDWSGIWWTPAATTNYYTNAFVSSTSSAVIYGIGKGWAIPKNNWLVTKIKLKEVIKKNAKRFFDVHLEKLIKFNFYVIMPYRSRILEEVSNGLTLKESFKNTRFYKHWSNSFIDNLNIKNKKYKYIKNMKYNWRYDCLNYNLINKVISFLLYYFTKILYYSIYIKRTIKKFV